MSNPRTRLTLSLSELDLLLSSLDCMPKNYEVIGLMLLLTKHAAKLRGGESIAKAPTKIQPYGDSPPDWAPQTPEAIEAHNSPEMKAFFGNQDIHSDPLMREQYLSSLKFKMGTDKG